MFPVNRNCDSDDDQIVGNKYNRKLHTNLMHVGTVGIFRRFTIAVWQ